MDAEQLDRRRPCGGHRHPPLSGAPDPGHRIGSGCFSGPPRPTGADRSSSSLTICPAVSADGHANYGQGGAVYMGMSGHAWRLIVVLCEIDLVNSADRPSSWFNALSKPQKVTAITMSLIGSIGGAAYLWLGPPTDLAPGFLIFAYVILSLMILNGIPRVHLWFDGRGFVLYLGVFFVLKGASRDLETPAVRVGVLVVGVLLLTYLIVRAVRVERRKRQTDRADSQIL
ncbi:hypothetical protein [Streptosporangium sp. NPDC049376]|uniref:hypothetical protein n=1 Tax=Streptosporangium sp. NPDC049376 TaxID=3366192 RepID=UPI0037BC8747